MRLQDLDDDILIQLFTLLPVASILILRQTCTHFSQISRLRFVWQNVCRTQVLAHGYPFQCRRLARADAPELERLVRHALRLAAFWSTPSDAPRRSVDFQASTGTGVSHVRLLPGRGGRYLLTVYKGIWSMISCWDLGSVPSAPTTPTPTPTVTKVADWCPRNTIFSGFVVNTEPDSDAALAVAVQHGGGTQSIELLTIFPGDDDGDGDDGEPPAFKSVGNIATGFHPVALRGDLIAFSDDASETVVMNWRKNTFALLKSSQRPVDEHFQYNRCLQVVFAHRSILIVRARSVELFPEPELRPADGEYVTYAPVGFHTFGWIDGVAVVPQCGTTVDANDVVKASGHEPLSILLRAESDDPWASDVHTLEQFVLHPNPAFDNHSNSNSASPPPSSLPDGSSQPSDPDVQPTSVPASAPVPIPPYLFPPVRAEHTSPTVRGFLRCRDIVLGPSGTALWIQPRAARTAHLTGYDVHASSAPVDEALDPDRLRPLSPSPGPSPGHAQGRTAESLCAAVFEGPLQRRCAEVGMRMRMGMAMGMRMGPAARTLWAQTREGCNWTAFDYDEETGRVALGSSDGSVTVLDLV
ncbi:hypothetical protein L227DRAFT_521638 [Lentinus tigrinus ALCF2SS1-6]|uniref:F-box domain-containing protein n=1 Tax=Lentinus tigrinus ALCF2SS1-6 TaxID=1328759 RepID=A0A5C2SIF1_9APHY|nr:hypothetical protein L227DRAFT_521638 [Lentinus tigrinus ALCF2SS1-6]